MNVKGKLPWLLVLLVTLLLALVAAGCGGDDDDGGDAGDGDTTAATDEATTEEAEPIRVGLVTDIGGLNDSGFNQLANEGLERAADELGVEIRVLESKSDADYIPNLLTLAEEGFDLIIAVGFLMGEATAAGGRGSSRTRTSRSSTRSGRRFEERSGAAEPAGPASSRSRRPVTWSGTSPGSSPSRTRCRASAGEDPAGRPLHRRLPEGRADANPDIKVLNGYSQDFVDQAKCKEVALDQIAKGSDVVFQVAGGCGLGALDAAEEEGVWGIGVDADQSFLGEHILTSAVKRVDEAVFETIQSVVDGDVRGRRGHDLRPRRGRRRPRRDQRRTCRRRSSTRVAQIEHRSSTARSRSPTLVE